MPKTLVERPDGTGRSVCHHGFLFTPLNLAGPSPGTVAKELRRILLPKGALRCGFCYHSVGTRPPGRRDVGSGMIPAGRAGEGCPSSPGARNSASRAYAPSAMKDVYYGAEGSCPWSPRIPVVATDYHGLGTDVSAPIHQQNGASPEVVYSIPAHGAEKSLGAKWVVHRPSQGVWPLGSGRASTRSRIRLSRRGIRGRSGARGGLLQSFEQHPGRRLYLRFMAAGIHARYPEFDPRELLSDSVLEHMPTSPPRVAFIRLCDLRSAPTHPVRPNGTKRLDSPLFRGQRVACAHRRSAVVVAGRRIKTVPIEGVRAAVKQICAGQKPAG